MRRINTEVLVIGGGATGTGVVRDLAMRGFKTILVERSDLAQGTTGRYHGLLHSGGRYAVKDPKAAEECIIENQILRKIMPQCIEDTGGFFVVTNFDQPEFGDKFMAGCQQAGIPVEEISISQMLREEPLLNPKMQRCFRVPDGSADSFLGAELVAESARQHGAQILKYHKVLSLICQDNRVTGARVQDVIKDEEIEISADMVVNASGAWSGRITASVGISVEITPGKGVMVAMNHRIVNKVVNRCKMPSDGDIIVPSHTVSVIGTTDVKVADPDHFGIEPWEVRKMLDEGNKLVPGFKDMRMVRCWAGVRPLYQEVATAQNRDITRAFVLLDHETRDNMRGLITITSGKWTTYRKMAEATVDLVCKKLGVERPCTTHTEPLPASSGKPHYHNLGARLMEIEEAKAYGKLICECELATYDDVKKSIVDENAQTIDDIRRDVRLGMGPCQGGFCTYRAAGLLHQFRSPGVEATNGALRDFLEERWKGLLPVLWGQQLRQERLDQLIYLSILNVDHLPGPRHTPLGPIPYTLPEKKAGAESGAPGVEASGKIDTAPQPTATCANPRKMDVVVIGAGLAGLTTAWQAASQGKSVRVISKGWGINHWHSGCIDVFGYDPEQPETPVIALRESLVKMIEKNPQHPYALVGIETIAEALEAFKELCQAAGYPMHGSIEKNWLLPSACGAFRPTCLAPEMMINGDLGRKDPMLIVGFEQYPDFYPHMIADNLQVQGISAKGDLLNLLELHERKFVTSRVLAELMETEPFRISVAQAVKSKLTGVARVGFPAVLGQKMPLEVKARLEALIGLPVFEIPTLPPSMAGIRLHNLLLNAIEANCGRVFDGMQAVSASVDGDSVEAVWTEAASRNAPNRAKAFVLASGGILGGGIFTEYREDQTATANEVIFGLPVQAASDRALWFDKNFLTADGHPIFKTGISVNSSFQPTDPSQQTLYKNLYIAGNTLSGADAIQERSVDGIALTTGYKIGKQIL